MPKINAEVSVSLETFNEIANGLEAKGIKFNREEPIVLNKDVSIKNPIDYRLVQIRRDVIVEITKVYVSPLDVDGNSKSDSQHFINFLDDVFNYILKGVKTEATVETNPKKEWGK